MNISEILAALVLSLNIGCVWFLSHSFLLIGLPLLRTLGAGGYFEEPPNLFGVRWQIVESAIRQKSEVVYGLFLLLCSSITSFVLLFHKSLPPNWFICVIAAAVILAFILLIGHFVIAPYLYYCYFMTSTKKSLATFRKYWLALDTNQRNKKLSDELRYYHLKSYYERLALIDLKKYFDSILKSANS